MFFAAITKENIPLIVIAFGIYGLFSKQRNKLAWGLVPLVFGAAVFYIMMFVITPALRTELGTPTGYLSLYAHISDTPDGIVKTVLFHPGAIIKLIFSPVNLYFIRTLFGPLLFLSILSPHILFLVSPVLLQHFLSGAMSQHTIFYHYAATVIPFIFLASVNSLRWIRERFRLFIYYAIFTISAISCILFLPEYMHILQLRSGAIKDYLDPARMRMVKQVPSDVSAVGTFVFLDHISQRKDLYSFYSVWLGRNIFTPESPYPDPKQVEYALVDFNDPWIPVASSYKDPEEVVYHIQDFFTADSWKILDVTEDIVLFGKKGDTDISEFLKHSRIPFFSVSNKDSLSLEGRTHLISYEIGQYNTGNKSLLPFKFYWRCDEDINDMYRMLLSVKKDDEIITSRARTVGYTLYPTIVWKKGDYIRERYWLLLPDDLEPGRYSIDVAFMNAYKNRLIKMSFPDKQRFTPKNFFKLGTFTVK